MRITGGWYCDALTDKAFAALVTGSHIETNAGRVPLPNGQNVLFVRCGPHGQIAGIGHKDDQAWLWSGGKWTSHGLAFGPNAVIFDAQGALRIISKAPAVGYRYVAENGALVTCESTYADKARGIYEYTTLAGYTIGQGGEGPDGDDPAIAILPDGTRRLISKGRCRSIRVRQSGDLFSIAWSREDLQSAEIVWLTVAGLRALPKPTPINQPPPDEEPPPVSIPDHKDTVVAARKKYDNKSGEERAYLIANFVAWTHRNEGAGLFYKTGGTNHNERSIDIVIYKTGETFDILGDAEGEARPQWGRTAPTGFGDPAKWRAAVDPATFEDNPPPPPPPPPPDGDDIFATLLKQAQQQHVALGKTLDDLFAQLPD